MREKVREKARDWHFPRRPRSSVRPKPGRFTLQLRRPAILSRIAVFSVGCKLSAAKDDMAGFFLPA